MTKRKHSPIRSAGGESKNAPRAEIVRIPSGHHLVIGRNAVRELVRAQPARIERIVISLSAEEIERGADLPWLSASPVRTQQIHRRDMDTLTNGSAHQGIVAIVRDLISPALKDVLKELSERSDALVLVLDGIQDPHNLGAILRAAECFGVDAVIWSHNRGAQLSTVVSKVSAGASEFVTSVVVSNVVDAARKLRDADFMLVGADVHGHSLELSEVPPAPKVALVLGSEGEGIHRLLGEQLDFRARITMRGKIDSLNVSQATAVFLYALRDKQVR